MSTDVWHVQPLPGSSLSSLIKDENGLEVATCIAEDAPLIAAAPRLAAALRDALTLIDALMPGVRHIALQDYKALNDVPLAGMAALKDAGL